MTFDNIKLDKGLYTTSKGFTATLEEIDPSENYVGTSLEGLDAYERQLKRFDIKVKGENSDTISKFFATTDSAALFPEYVARAVRMGANENNLVDDIVATTTNIDALDYRSIESVNDSSSLELAEVGEGAIIPQTTIKTSSTLTKLHKRGRMLVASYEALKYQKLDLFTITLKQIGEYIARCQFKDAIDTIKSTSGIGEVELSDDTLTYEDMISLYSTIYPYNLTNIIASSDMMNKILNMSEFKDSNAGLNFHGSGNMITPFGAKIVRSDVLNSGEIIGIDKNYAIEKVQAGDIVTEYDKLIDRQLERASITATAGFSPIFAGAISTIGIDVVRGEGGEN